MVPYLGDFPEDATVYIPFNTFSSDDPSASVTITNLADADIKVHKDASTTQIVTDGATIAIDFDSITGNHIATIDTSAHADYSTGSDYLVRIEGTTVDGATINAFIGQFSIENRTSFPKADFPTNFASLGIESDGDVTKVNTLDGHTAQTGDSFARIGAPAGASVSADIADVPTVAEFEARTLVAASYFDPAADTVATVTSVTNGVSLANGAITDASLAGNMEIVFETDFGTNYNATRNAWATNVQDTVGTGTLGLNDLSAAQVNSECDTALSDIHLDHLFAATYDPSSKPGTADALLNELVENDGGVSRFTSNALDHALTATGFSTHSAANVVDEWETQSQSDPTGFHVNVIEVGGTSQTAGDLAGMITTVDTVADRIEVDAQDIQSRLPATLVSGKMDSDATSISGDATAADRLEAMMDGVIIGQVNDASATTTAFAADGFTEATDDHFIGRLITFISGALTGQQTDITDYDAAGGTQGSQEFTVTTLTEAPADDDFFVIH